MARTATLFLSLMLTAATACRPSTESRRFAMSALRTFVIHTVFDLPGRAALTQSSARPAPQTTATAKPAAPTASPATDSSPMVFAMEIEVHSHPSCPYSVASAATSAL